MTFEDAKKLLQDIKHAKRRARVLNEEITELLSFKENLLSGSTYNNIEQVNSFDIDSKVDKAIFRAEMVADKLEEKKAELSERLLDAFALEDKIAEALNDLPKVEQDIIIGCYMRGQTHWQLAEEMGYSERSVRYIKNSAIEKISEKL